MDSKREMDKGGDGKCKVRKVTDPRQFVFEFVESYPHDIEYVGLTPEGHGLFRRMEGHGGYAYWTDEVPTGVMVFDEGISNVLSTFSALDHLGDGKALWAHIGVVFDYDK